VPTDWERGDHYEAVIVGAGIAGLSAAWELRDRAILVLEAADRVGGRMRSEPRGPYWLNQGAHLFPGAGTHLARLVDDMGLETRVIPGNRMGLALNGRLVVGGRPETYPLRLPLSLGARLSFVRAGLRLRRAARGYLRAARPRPGETLSEMRARVLAYGDDQVFAEYLGPLHPDVAQTFQAIAERIAAGPDEISVGCGAALFALVWGSDDTLARNLLGGSALLPQALARRLGARVVVNAPVETVVPDGERVRVRFRVHDEPREVSATYVVAATPADITARLVRDLPADTRDALRRIQYGPFVCASILTGERGPMPWDPVYAIATPGKCFNMLFNHANPLRREGSREAGGSLMVYGGGPSGRRLLPMSDDAIRDGVLADLHALLPETRDIVQEVLVQRWERGVPYAAPGRHRLQPALERPLGRIFLAGDYLEFAEMEVAAVTGREAGQAIRDKLGRS